MYKILLLTLTLLTVSFTTGCGDSRENFVFTNTNNVVITGNQLTVTPDVSLPIAPRITDDATQFRVSVFNNTGSLVSEQTVARGQSAIFQNLVDGFYLVRTVGLNANNNVIGFFDQSINLSGDLALTVPALITANTVPNSTVPVTAQGSVAFLAFTELPDTITGGNNFALAVTAFDADGSVFAGANGNVVLSVSGVQNQNLGNANFANGVANFPTNQFPIVTVGNATFTGTSDNLNAQTPPIPVVAGQLLEPATELTGSFLTIFYSAVAPIATQLDNAIFPQYAHQWELLQSNLGISDGGRDSYDGANRLSVSLAGANSFATFEGPNFVESDLTWLTPLFDQSDGLVAATAVPPSSGFSTDASTVAYLAPGKDNRLQQQLDLSNATGTTTLTWRDAFEADANPGISIANPLYRVVIRGANDQILETLFSSSANSGSTNRNAALTAFNGQIVTLSFELVNVQGQAFSPFNLNFVDDVSVIDGNASQFVTNGNFETGDLSGWTTSLAPLSQHVRSPIRAIAGVDIRRFIYADPSTNWCRYTEQFTNSTAADIAIEVQLETNLGSDGDEIPFNAPNATGLTFSTSDADGSDDDLGFVFGTGATLDPVIADVDGEFTVNYTLTIPAGETRCLVSFLIQDNESSSGAEPTALLTQIANMSNNLLTSPQLLRGLSQAQFDAIANF